MSIDKRTIKAKSNFQIGLPAQNPNIELINILQSTFREKESIIKAYLFMKGVAQQEEPILTLGVLFSITDNVIINTTMLNIVNILEENLGVDQQIDLMILNNNPNIIEILQKIEGTTIFTR